MHQNFGSRLRQRREDQGIALATIADQTKIKQSLLESLERDDVSHWPSGIFRRAYIRAYAQAIGLSPDDVLREFLEVHAEPLEEFETALATALATGVRGTSGPPTRLRNIVGSALGSLSRLRRSAAPDDVAIQRPPSEPPVPIPVEILAVHPADAAGPIEMADDSAVEVPPVPPDNAEPVSAEVIERPAATPGPDLSEVARVCTELGRIQSVDDVPRQLSDAAHLLDAFGLIVWIWDAEAEGLRPAFAHGYSERVLAQLPTVSRDADNVTAAAFRTEAPCTMNAGDRASGALVLPLLTPSGCAGVLAVELQQGGEQNEELRAIAAILAAAVAQLVDRASIAEAEPEVEAPVTDAYFSPLGRVAERR